MMRKLIDLVALNEDEITKGDIKKSTWTYCQDHDGIYVICPGSNSCFAGFSSEAEAKHFAAEQGPEWKAIRWGKFKTMSDDEALQDHDVRRRREQHGFWNPPLQEDVHPMDIDDEEETPAEREAYERQRRIEAAVKQFCEQELGWDMDGSFPVIFEADDNTLSLSPNEGEATLEQLTKLGSLGEVTISAASRQWALSIDIKTPPGFDISRA